MHAVGENTGGDDDQERARPREEPGEVQADRTAVDQVSEHGRGRDSEHRAEERLGRAGGPLGGRRLGGRPEEESGLEPFPPDREQRHDGQCPPAAVRGPVDLPAQLAQSRAPSSPSRRSSTSPSRRRRSRARPPMSSCASKVSRVGAEGEQCADASATAIGEPRPRPQPRRKHVTAPEPRDQVRHEDADDEGRFEAFSETDEIVGEHVGSKVSRDDLSGAPYRSDVRETLHAT